MLDIYGTSPPSWALAKERERAVDWLVEHGADLQLDDEFGATAARLQANGP